ncbi:MAG TPA: hypothetical protein VK513_01500 [Terriglobales bacterium]|nr:hypothetical protein [Terriglobales bacterium]
MQELEESDREHFTLLVAMVRAVVGASGLVCAIEDLKQHLEANDLQGAAAVVQVIKDWLTEMDARAAIPVTDRVM